MKYEKDNEHPRKRDGQKPVKMPCCATKVGRLGVWGQEESEFSSELSPGVSIYFKFLKFFVCMFLWFTIISMPTFWMYAGGNNSEVGGFDFKNLMTVLSLGNVGESTTSCLDSGIISGLNGDH
jgi:hypothetical protein